MPLVQCVEYTNNSVNIVGGVPTLIVHNQNMLVRQMVLKQSDGVEVGGLSFIPDINDPLNRGYLTETTDNYPNLFIWLFGVQPVPTQQVLNIL